ncbi:MAG TPA: ureidoglycolate lyase [Thermomicrobiales bacterium]|nr:ureidoglycolate lyase [Thermomicrobiales bacterium]
MRIPVEELTPDAFAPYGAVIEQPDATADASGSGWSWWSEISRLPQADRPYAVGYLNLQPSAMEFDWAERHLKSAEVIIPLGGACLVYVGPPDQTPVWDQFRVYRVRPGQAVVLKEGIWHGAPLALDHPLTALVLLRQGTGTEDVYKSERTEGPMHVVPNETRMGEGERTHASR